MGSRWKHLTGKGEWTPGLPPDLAMVGMIAFGVETGIRGLDYIGGDREGTTSSLTSVEKALPLQAWGVLCILAFSIYTFGILRRRAGAVIVGSVLAMAVYGALAAGMAMTVVERGWPPDGFRTPPQFLIFGLMFGLFALSAYLRRTAGRASDHMREEGTTDDHEPRGSDPT